MHCPGAIGLNHHLLERHWNRIGVGQVLLPEEFPGVGGSATLICTSEQVIHVLVRQDSKGLVLATGVKCAGGADRGWIRGKGTPDQLPSHIKKRDFRVIRRKV